MSTKTKSSNSGCLKIALYVFIAFVVLGIIGSLIGDDPQKLTSDGMPYPTDSLGIAKMDSIERARTINDSIAITQSEAKVKKILKGLRVKTDDFEEVSFYYGGGVIPYTNINRLFLYMPYKDGSRPSLRMKVQYAGEDWIFWNEAELKVDGEKMSLLGMGTVDRDNDGGKVWEFTDSRVDRNSMDDENNLRVIREVATSKTTTIRLSGKYRNDRTITNSEKKAMREILEAYDSIMEELKN